MMAAGPWRRAAAPLVIVIALVGPLAHAAPPQPILGMAAKRPILDMAAERPILDMAAERPILDMAAERPILDMAAERPILDMPAKRSPAAPTTACALCSVLALADEVIFATPPLLRLPEVVEFLYRTTDAEFVHLKSTGSAPSPAARHDS